MDSIILCHVSESTDYCAKLTIKRKERQVRVCIWDCDCGDYSTVTYSCWTQKRAFKRYQREIGLAILGGWSVLNKYPEKVTWD